MKEKMFPVLSFSRGLAFPQYPISCLDETPNNPYALSSFYQVADSNSFGSRQKKDISSKSYSPSFD